MTKHSNKSNTMESQHRKQDKHNGTNQEGEREDGKGGGG